ncbi:hypothetical protein [Prochlorococcus sp. MIT 1307]|uniref:hypothetical protein n=1 Tax=Prochlorococcus sp. MIT 1307 TaxID=3096219 RepID=UPI002A74AF85|nr:hypothetical protein [Prochlorococcus sp. MIT 1307]
MYSFDPAINYGPNDAGVSAFSIAIVLVGILVGSWLLGAAYGFIANSIKSINEPENKEK